MFNIVRKSKKLEIVLTLLLLRYTFCVFPQSLVDDLELLLHSNDPKLKFLPYGILVASFYTALFGLKTPRITLGAIIFVCAYYFLKDVFLVDGFMRLQDIPGVREYVVAIMKNLSLLGLLSLSAASVVMMSISTLQFVVESAGVGLIAYIIYLLYLKGYVENAIEPYFYGVAAFIIVIIGKFIIVVPKGAFKFLFAFIFSLLGSIIFLSVLEKVSGFNLGYYDYLTLITHGAYTNLLSDPDTSITFGSILLGTVIQTTFFDI